MMNKKTSFSSLVILILPCLLYSQQPSWTVDDVSHVAFKYHDGMYEQESAHWTPGDLGFWTDNTYTIGSNLNPNRLRVFDADQAVDIDLSSLVFSQIVGVYQVDERVRLDYDGLKFINAGSWSALDAYIWGAGGQLDLYSGGGSNYLVRLGSTSENSLRGSLRLYGPNGSRSLSHVVSGDNSGYSYYYGTNGNTNVFIGNYAGAANRGALFVADGLDNQQAGMYVNSSNEGIVWGDMKTFRMAHPTDKNREIWYVSLEGPEAGAYERGTATLVEGEAFIEFSEHYQIVANPNTMTVQITPLDWDTYGLAVVEKTQVGFKVKELKGGTGNFSFDWEVKCKRNGKEDFQVVRATNDFQKAEKAVEEATNPRQNYVPKPRQLSKNPWTHLDSCLVKKSAVKTDGDNN
jgi:hypothetical protein